MQAVQQEQLTPEQQLQQVQSEVVFMKAKAFDSIQQIEQLNRDLNQLVEIIRELAGELEVEINEAVKPGTLLSKVKELTKEEE